MKGKKGFTLIELLAIIVILAIIAVITVPIILNVIDNSKKGAAVDSALAYKEAIYKGFLNDLTLEKNKELPSGIYVIDSTGKLINGNGVILSVNVSGNEPEENSWVELEKGQVMAFSLKFDEYVVTKYKDTDAEAVKNGEIAENTEAREARLEAERQASAKVKAKTLATSQTGTTEIIEITEGWVAFINGEVKAYSLKVTEGDYVYVVTDFDVNSTNSNAVADRTISDVASTIQAEQLVVSAKADSYVKAALQANSSLSSEDALLVSDMSSVTTNQPNSGWIHFNVESSTVSVVDYSLTYGTITANYSSLTDGSYVSIFGESRNKPAIVVVGSTKCFGPDNSQECFKVVKKFTELDENNNEVEKALLFANYGLKKIVDSTTNPESVIYLQNRDNPDRVAFSNDHYWNSYGTLVSAYAKDVYGNPASFGGNPRPYIYDSNSFTYDYVEGYLITLKQVYNLPESIVGRLLSYEEAFEFGCTESGGSCPIERIYEQRVWLGSADKAYCVKTINTNERRILPERYQGTDYSTQNTVRPGIIINTADL